MRRHRPTARGRLSTVVAATAVVVAANGVAPGAAHATSCTVTWLGPSGAADPSGAWEDAANWSSGGVPSGRDDVCLTAPGSYIVTMAADADVHSLTLGDGTNAPTLQLQGQYMEATTLGVATDSAIARGATLQLTGESSSGDAVAVATGATLTNAGTLDVERGSGWPGRRTVEGGFDNQGTVRVAPVGDPYYLRAPVVLQLTGPVANLDGDGTLTGGVWDNSGSLVLPTDTPVTVNDATVVQHRGSQFCGPLATDLFQPQVNLGSITIDGGIWHWAAPFDNRGSLEIVGGAELFAGGGYTQNAADSGPPPVTTVRGTAGIGLDHGPMLLNAGMLTGDGYIGGWDGGVVNSGGTVRPDPTLSIAYGDMGRYTQTGAGVLDITVTDPTHATALRTGSRVTLGGTLRITTAAGVTPAPGVAIAVLPEQAAYPLGTFHTVTSVPASFQRTWRVATADPEVAEPAVTIRSMLVPSLTETLSSTTPIYGTAVRVGGRLTAGGAPEAGARVGLYQQPVGSSTWTAVASGTTTSSGGVAFTVFPTANVRYLLATRADATHVAASSAPVAVAVRTDFVLTAGQQVASTSGAYRLVMQSDGNLVEYGPGNRAVWSSRTNGHRGAYLHMQGNGDAVVYAAGRALWHTRTAGYPGARLVVRNDGRTVVYARSGRALWAS